MKRIYLHSGKWREKRRDGFGRFMRLKLKRRCRSADGGRPRQSGELVFDVNQCVEGAISQLCYWNGGLCLYKLVNT